MKKEILFRGTRTDNGEVVEGYYVIDPQNRVRIYLPPFEGCSSNTYYFVIPESVEQYSHVTQTGERIFKPIFYSPKSRADKMREMKEGDVMTFDRSLYGSIRAHCSVINKNRESKLKTKLSDDGMKIYVITNV